MKGKFRYLALGLALAAACSRNADNALLNSNGPKGALFELLPIDLNQQCKANILKGTQRFKGTAYIMPTFVVSSSSGTNALEVFRRQSDNKYVVQLLLKPLSGEEPLPSKAGEKVKAVCDFKAIKDYLARLPADKRIDTLSANLPLRRVELKIVGIDGATAATVGSHSTSVLDYQNKPQLAEFVLTENEYTEFKSRLAGHIGAGIDVDIIFSAQAVASFIDANVQAQKIALNLETALKGNIPANGLVTNVQLQAALSEVVENHSSEIVTEGTSAANDEIVKSLMQTILENSSVSQSDLPSASVPDAAEKANLNIKQVISFLNRQKNIKLRITRLGEAEEQRQTTRLILKSDGVDAGVTRLNVSTSSANNSLPTDVMAGSTLSLSSRTQVIEDFKYTHKKRYYAKREVVDLQADLASHFPYLQTLKDKHIREYDSAFGERVFVYQGYFWNLFNWKYYTWGEISTTLESKTVNRQIDLSAKPLEQIPLQVNFSKLGGKDFTLHNLLGENEWWSSKHNSFTGTIEIKAKKDLGRVSFSNAQPDTTMSITPVRQFQELWSAVPSAIVETQYSAVGNTKARVVSQQNTIWLDVSQSQTKTERIRLLVDGDDVFR